MREKLGNRERGASGGRVWETEGGRWRRTARFHVFALVLLT